jgi:hypothetical protein
VAQASNPYYLGCRFEASPGKKFEIPHPNQWLGVVACTYHPYHPSYTLKHRQEKEVQASPGIK